MEYDQAEQRYASAISNLAQACQGVEQLIRMKVWPSMLRFYELCLVTERTELINTLLSIAGRINGKSLVS